MATREERLYDELMNSSPQSVRSTETAAAEAALRGAEAQASHANYSTTADGKLDSAIDSYLTGRGFNYSTANDPEYQRYLEEYRASAQRARELGSDVAGRLSGGNTPSYAGIVGSEVYNDRMEGISDIIPQFKRAAQQEHAIDLARRGQAAQLAAQEVQTEYSRNREAESDYRNYMSYLANRYLNERENDAAVENANNEIYKSRLAAAQSQLEQTRENENRQYIYNTQSADSRAKIAEDEYENNRKLEYQKAEDAYNKRVKEQAAATKAAENEKKNAASMADKYQKQVDNTGKNISKIRRFLDDEKKLTADERYTLDYNKDGVVDAKDLEEAQLRQDAYAAALDEYAEMAGDSYTENAVTRYMDKLRGSGSKSSNVTIESSDKTSSVIKAANSAFTKGEISRNKDKFRTYLEKLIDENELTDGEAGMIYEYFNLV